MTSGEEKKVSAPAVSVVMPVKDGARHLARTVRALAPQLREAGDAAELIAVDDYSSDGSAEFLKTLLDGNAPHWKVVRPEATGGMSAGARAAGANASSGAWLWHVDCDDPLPDGALKRVLSAALANPGADAVALPFATLKADGSLIPCPSVPSSPEALAAWAPGPWCKIWKRGVWKPCPWPITVGEDVVNHFLSCDNVGSVAALEGAAPVYVWDCSAATSGGATRAMEWLRFHPRSFASLCCEAGLEQQSGCPDGFVSASLRAVAALYDTARSVRRQHVRAAAASRAVNAFSAAVLGYCGA